MIEIWFKMLSSLFLRLVITNPFL